MFEMTNQSMCVIVIILCILLIPKYLQLPKSLELLYQDKFGQLLLLILAALIFCNFNQIMDRLQLPIDHIEYGPYLYGART